MSNFLANVVRRAAGIAAQLHGVPTATIRPVIPLRWRPEAAVAHLPEVRGEQSWSSSRQAVPDQSGDASPIVSKVLPEMANAAPAKNPSTKDEQVPVPAVTFAAHPRLAVDTIKTAAEDTLPAAAASANSAPDAKAHAAICQSRSEDDSSPLATMVELHFPWSEKKSGESRKSPDTAVLEKWPETRRSQFADQRTAPDVAPYRVRNERGEAEAEISRVTPISPAIPTPVTHVLPQQRSDVPQDKAATSSSMEPSAVVVRIGKVEVRANQPQRVVRTAHAVANSGFADMALRRAHLDRHYR